MGEDFNLTELFRNIQDGDESWQKIKRYGVSTQVAIQTMKEEDFISRPNRHKHKNADDPRFVIQNWMRTRFTVEFLGIWEQLGIIRFLAK